MDIESMNNQITACRMLNQKLGREYNTAQPVIHQEMLADVREHRNIWGLTSMFTIKRQLVKTRRFCRIMNITK